MKNKKGKFRISKVFRSNKFVFIVSFLVAVVIWIVMSIDASSETTRTITDIPISIALSSDAQESGLRIFSGADEKASVTVTGSRVALGGISKEDIAVSAQTANTINTPGNHYLSLTATKVNVGDQFSITSQPSPAVITVYVDYYREKEFNITDQVIYQVEKDYYASTNLSATTVTVSGPQDEISKIDSVSVSDRIQGVLTSDVKTTLPVKLYDSSGYEISSNLITMSVNEVDVTISVLPEKTISVKPVYKNAPSGINISEYVSIDPSEILVAGPKTVIDNISEVSLEDIDFSKINNIAQTLELGVIMPEGCRNLSNRNIAEVSLDFSSMSRKAVRISDFSVERLSSNYTASVTTQSLDVIVIGPKEQLDEVDATDIRATIDASTLYGTTGSTSIPVSIKISGNNGCWVFGSYQANVTISEKKQ